MHLVSFGLARIREKKKWCWDEICEKLGLPRIEVVCLSFYIRFHAWRLPKINAFVVTIPFFRISKPTQELA